MGWLLVGRRAFPNNGAPRKVENFMARTCDGFEYDSKRTGKFFNQRAARTRELGGRNVLLSLLGDVPEFSFSAFDMADKFEINCVTIEFAFDFCG